MSIKIEYVCDRCGHVQGTPTQFWTLGVTAKTGNDYSNGTHSVATMQVCRPCLDTLGIFVKPTEKEPNPVKPSLEDVILEIVANSGLFKEA